MPREIFLIFQYYFTIIIIAKIKVTKSHSADSFDVKSEYFLIYAYKKPQNLSPKSYLIWAF